MIKSFINIFILFIAGYFILLVFLFLMQKKLIYFPISELEADPSFLSVEFEDVFLQIKENSKKNLKTKEYIHGWFIPVENSVKTVIFFHGNGGNISHRLDTISLIVNNLKCSLFIFDYRGYGKSTGSPSELNTYEDAEIVINYIVNEKKIPFHSIILWGRSLGGAIAINLAIKYPPKALIVESGFSSISDMASHLYPYSPAKFLIIEKYDSFNKVNKINSPKLFIHSKEDDVIPYKLGYKLYKNAKNPKKFIEIQGDHNNGFMDSKDIYLNAIFDFLSSLPHPFTKDNK